MSDNTVVHKKSVVGKVAFLNLGFRPFFLGASLFAFLSILLWMGIYVFHWTPPLKYYTPITWHAHEMIFGYSIAVIAGFLLTAVKNWTGIPTLTVLPLLGLFSFWVFARLLSFFTSIVSLETIAIIDNLFILFLILALAIPLIQAKKWRNMGIMAILVFLLSFNIVFYLGISGIIPNGVHIGLYSSLYLVLALIFTMASRVIPLFIKGGVGYPVELKNWKWGNISGIVTFILFWITDLIIPFSLITAGLAGLLFLIHGVILWGWYTTGIWKKPLLWVLYLAYSFIVFGFGLKAVATVWGISPYLAIHSFAFGGIGMMTIGMMARVSWGHTGRDIQTPPKVLNLVFLTLFCGALIRVIFPLVDPLHYILWIVLSQVLWMGSFGLFIYIYFPILIYPRVDGRDG